MSKFAALKNKDTLNEVKKALESQQQKNNGYEDERFFRPSLSIGKDGNGEVIFRLLPDQHYDPDTAPEFRKNPYAAKYYSYAYKGKKNKYYIENSLVSIGQKDPFAEYVSSLTYDKTDITGNKNRKRKIHYVSNIYIINDKVRPENNGKVFLFDYGPFINGKIEEAAGVENKNKSKTEEDPDAPKLVPLNTAPFDPFNLWKGANFKLKIKTKGEMPNYEDSFFMKAAPLFDDDEKLEEVYNATYDLNEFYSEKFYKTRAQLEKRLTEVLGVTYNSGDDDDNGDTSDESVKTSRSFDEDDDIPFDTASSRKFDEDDDDDDARLRRALEEDD